MIGGDTKIIINQFSRELTSKNGHESLMTSAAPLLIAAGTQPYSDHILSHI